jgi:hypothetical protein
VLIVEKDTMEPVCSPMASQWQMPYASSRGYGSAALQYKVAHWLRTYQRRTGQFAVVYFISDFDPSGLDLQRAWEAELDRFHVLYKLVRIGLTREQAVEQERLAGRSLSLEVKASDSRSEAFVAAHGIALGKPTFCPLRSSGMRCRKTSSHGLIAICGIAGAPNSRPPASYSKTIFTMIASRSLSRTSTSPTKVKAE